MPVTEEEIKDLVESQILQHSNPDWGTMEPIHSSVNEVMILINRAFQEGFVTKGGTFIRYQFSVNSPPDKT